MNEIYDQPDHHETRNRPTTIYIVKPTILLKKTKKKAGTNLAPLLKKMTFSLPPKNKEKIHKEELVYFIHHKNVTVSVQCEIGIF